MISRHSREDLLYGACVIGPPKTPSVFILFLNWKLNQQISSTFLVFDLVGRDVGFKRERNAGRFVHPKLDDAHKALRFRPRPRIGVMEYWSIGVLCQVGIAPRIRGVDDPEEAAYRRRRELTGLRRLMLRQIQRVASE
jgi:hypothetical protein